MSSAVFNTRGIPYPALRYYVFNNLDNATQTDLMDVLGCEYVFLFWFVGLVIKTRLTCDGVITNMKIFFYDRHQSHVEFSWNGCS